jgi:hypothetical protein
MAFHVGFFIFIGLMAAQASGASVSCAYAWDRADRKHDSDSDSDPRTGIPTTARMLWRPA